MDRRRFVTAGAAAAAGAAIPAGAAASRPLKIVETIDRQAPDGRWMTILVGEAGERLEMETADLRRFAFSEVEVVHAQITEAVRLFHARYPPENQGYAWYAYAGISPDGQPRARVFARLERLMPSLSDDARQEAYKALPMEYRPIPVESSTADVLAVLEDLRAEQLEALVTHVARLTVDAQTSPPGSRLTEKGADRFVELLAGSSMLA